MDESNGLLPDDKLTILCRVRGISQFEVQVVCSCMLVYVDVVFDWPLRTSILGQCSG